MLIDTHCHLDYLTRADAEYNPTPEAADAILARASAAGVRALINPNVDCGTLPDVMALAEAHPCVYAAVAIHPTEVDKLPPDWQAQLLPYFDHPKVVALGETGLDYYWTQETQAEQQAAFRWFLKQGQRLNKPVIVHDRDAHDDVANIIADYPDVQVIMHCFSGDAAFAERMMALGAYISFAGNVTFKKATDLHHAAQAVPLERLLVETDSPFLSPHPLRGQRNEPARVSLVAQQIADLKGVSLEIVHQQTTQNACQVFGISL
jgi:TatD DNase family protein